MIHQPAPRVAAVSMVFLLGISTGARPGEPSLRVHCLPGAEAYRSRVLSAWRVARAKIEARTGLRAPVPITVTICRDRGQLHGMVPHAPAWAAAIALPAQRAMVIDAASWSCLGETATATVAHELSHLVLGGAAAGRSALFPKWFSEGLACWASDRSHMGDVEQMELAAALKRLPGLASLEAVFPADGKAAALAYLTSERFVGYLSVSFGPDSLRRVIAETFRTQSFPRAFEKVFRRPSALAELEWHERLKEQSPPVLALLRRVNLFAVMALLAVAAFVATRLRNRRRQHEWENEGAGL